ncbi:hypothetical protein D1007_34511 [Hordeum vulgare]|uniref:Acidic protein n=1 Tax=Hordeum vulgare subsp. vulgare TaxID=112509 RepID=A0A8I6X091_HORVV|nr:uncharacterized protein LOC123429031 [Hordeum vulgare subsp. vulgare]KAE8791070.1 hypothetical protein D1007_34511 [Hordeum vulgare]KAI4968953.1 hypothetical protein ZWY2020_046283 [Hordeum vulgare]
MAAKQNASIVRPLLIATLLVAAVASSVPVARGEEKAPPTCFSEYSKLCGKGEKKDAACTTMVEKACGTEASSVAKIEHLFVEFSSIGQKVSNFNGLTTSGGQDVLKESVDKHGGCPGNTTTYVYSAQCNRDCNEACSDGACSNHCYMDCPYMAARFCYIIATPANKKAIEEDMECFKQCSKDGTNDKCRAACKLSCSPPAP